MGNCCYGERSKPKETSPKQKAPQHENYTKIDYKADLPSHLSPKDKAPVTPAPPVPNSPNRASAPRKASPQVPSTQSIEKILPNPHFPTYPLIRFGLNNIGNTCFANSVLTCLYFVPELSSLFTGSSKTSGLESAMRRFYSHFQEGRNTGDLVADILRNLPKYDDRKQHPAYSFLKDLLDAQKGLIEPIFTITIEESRVCTVCGGDSAKESKQETMSLAVIAGKMQGNVLHFSRTMFYHTEMTQIAPNSIAKDDYKRNLLAYFANHKRLEPSEGSFSLENSLKYKLATEICEEDLSLRCRRDCESDQTHLKQTFIRSLGPVFVCYFERFHIENPRVPIAIPTQLDMRQYAKESGSYHLMAVVNHSGTELGGHYTSLVKGSNGWIAFNDSLVREEKAPDFSKSTMGVIAFYRADR